MLTGGIVIADNGKNCILTSVKGAVTNRTKMYAIEIGIGDGQSFWDPASVTWTAVKFLPNS